MRKFCLSIKNGDKVVRHGEVVDHKNKLFGVRGESGMYINEIISGKRVRLYFWVEKEMLWRPMKK